MRASFLNFFIVKLVVLFVKAGLKIIPMPDDVDLVLHMAVKMFVYFIIHLWCSSIICNHHNSQRDKETQQQ